VATLKTGNTQVEYRQTGSGRDLVLLHSLLTDMSVFEGIVPALAKNRRLTLINLPGYGASGPIEAAGIEQYADHIAMTLRSLDLPAETDVFGNGFGGFIAVALAIRHGANLGDFVIADALAAFPPAAKEPLRGMAARVESEGMAAVLDVAVKRMFPDAFIAAHPEVIAERKAALAHADASAFARACRALAALDFTAQLSRVTNETLVTVGELDATTPPAEAAKLAEGITGAQFRPLAGCGHCPMLEKPDELVALIEEFLGP
jgi:3-oxoadipate enol-lactonase